MFRVTRPDQDILVISEKPLHALVRMGIWLCVAGLFYAVVLFGGVPGEAAAAGGRSWHEWLFLLFPLFLLPYLIDSVRGILGAGDLILNGCARTVSRRRRPLAAFGDIRELQLRAVNATCEEFRLSAALADGRVVTLLESRGTPGLNVLAEEMASMIGVEVSRAG